MISVLAIAYLSYQTYNTNIHLFNYKYEYYVPSLTLVADEKPLHLNVLQPSYIDGNASKIITDIKDVTVNKLTNSANSQNTISMYIDDTFTFGARHKKNKNVLAILPTQCVLFFVMPVNKANIQMLLKPTIVIGYTRNEELDLMNMLIQTIKDDILKFSPKYQFRQIKPTNKIDATVFDTNGLDAMTVFASMDSDASNKISTDFKVDIIDYAEYVDMDKLKVAVPYAKKINIDFSLYFKQLQGKRDTVKTVIVFDVLLYGDKGINQIPFEFEEILSRLDKPELLNYYSQYFQLYDASKDYMTKKNMFIKTRSAQQILEQYANAPDTTFVMNKNIDGFYDSKNNTFSIQSHIVNNIPMKKGTIILLSQQQRSEENGKYEVINAKRGFTLLKKNTTNPLSKDGQFDPRYRCYDHPDIVSKGLCEASFDQSGRPKAKQTYWDRPCEMNEECPFYQANKNFKNYRGGCIDGRCEMPIGIRQVAYRLYDPKSKPLCHGCKDINNPFCCDEQKDKTLYPKLSSPDYAFANDEFERLQ